MTDATTPAATIDRLARGIRRCRSCPLHRGRTHAVPGEGPARPRLVLIGEAPGEKEDLRGRPFCGRAGHELDRLLERIGVDRCEVFITSAVKCRPPGNRNPHREELDICRRRWLERQIDILDPAIILLLGRIPALQLLAERRPLGEVHGRPRIWRGRRAMITYHPAATMRFPKARSGAEEDFDRLKRML